MMRLLSKLELPLFFRELIELSAKKRTYVTRVVYAIVLFSVGFGALSEQLLTVSNLSSNFSMMGSGTELFSALFTFQMVAIHTITPALVCSAITLEKERNTLGLLLLTRLGPFRILFEKLCSRLLPMVTCLLLSVPILALSYSLGGLNTNALFNGIFLLLLTCLQVGALTLMCSAFYRTMPGAFVASYLVQAAIAMPTFFSDRASRRYGEGVSAFESVSGWGLWMRHGNVGFSDMLWNAKWIMGMSLIFFLLARVFLIRRSGAKSKSRVMAFFKVLDRFFVWLNQATGGITIVNDVGSLPKDEPIAWREVTKRSLGTARYLFRVFLAIEIPTGFVCLLATGVGTFQGESTRLGGLTLTLWVIVGLIVAIKSASLVASERSSETLDALLTTPLTSREIIQQKCAGLRRLLYVTAIPLMTAAGFSAYMKGFPNQRAVMYTFWAIGSIIVLIRLIAWSSVWIGLGMKTETRSSFAAISLLIAAVAIPLVCVELLGVRDANAGPFAFYSTAVSLIIGPFIGLLLNEYGISPYIEYPGGTSQLTLVFIHLGFHLLLTYAIQRRVFSVASRQLGRGEASVSSSAVVQSSTNTSSEQYEPYHAVS